MYVLFSMYTTNISEFNIYISIFMYLGLMKLDFDMTGIVLFPFVVFFYIKYWYIYCVCLLLQVVFVRLERGGYYSTLQLF